MLPIKENVFSAEQQKLDLTGEDLVLPLHVEELVVARRQIVRSVVRVATKTNLVDKLVEEDLLQERVEVERVPVGHYIDAFPPVREEGDLTIMPVVEEVLVIERKYLLKEEVHIRRIRTTERHLETVQIRQQKAVITRTPTPIPDPDVVPASIQIHSNSNPKDDLK